MAFDPHSIKDIPAGTPVLGFDGSLLGTVREAYPHYILVDQEDEHDDLNIPVHSITGFEDGRLRVSINRASASAVDHEETVHHLNGDQAG
jgi:hypothetical protein